MRDLMEIDHWIKEIEQVSTEIEGLISGKNNDQLNWKAASTEWSVLQVLEHLTAVNRSYFPLADSLRSGAYRPPLLGRINFIVNLFGKLILKSVQPQEVKKTRTFPIWQPENSQLDPACIENFLATQTELTQWIQSNEDLIALNPVVSSPASNNVVYRLQVLVDIIVAHEKRHVLQIKKILDQAD